MLGVILSAEMSISALAAALTGGVVLAVEAHSVLLAGSSRLWLLQLHTHTPSHAAVKPSPTAKEIIPQSNLSGLVLAVVGGWLPNVPATCLCNSEADLLTVLYGAATLIKELLVKHAISSSHSILTPVKPNLAWSLKYQTPGRVAIIIITIIIITIITIALKSTIQDF